MQRDHYDALEVRNAQERDRDLAVILPALIARAMTAPGWAAQLAGIDPAAVTSRAALAMLPVLRKSDLAARQKETPPFGGFNVTPPGKSRRLLMSPGPIFEPQGDAGDYWGTARALFAAGFRAGDIVHNSFAYHLTPGGFIMEAGAHALGCAVIPAGPSNTEQQLAAVAHFRPSGYIGTPDFLKILLDAGAADNIDTSSIKRGFVSGAALPSSLRDDLKARGVDVLQCYATADVGMVAYESAGREGMITGETVIIEIVRPGTSSPVPDGEVGEVVVTSLSADYPMIRLATGDLSSVLPGISPCGRTNMRIRGWMGRADQAAKVKGMFVHPSQVAEIARRHPELGRLRLVIGRANEQDTMTLLAECHARGDALERSIGDTIQAVTMLKGVVLFVDAGSLPNDGKVIADERRNG